MRAFRGLRRRDAAIVLVPLALEAGLNTDYSRAPGGTAGTVGVLALLVAACGALAWRRVAPAGVFVLVWALAVVEGVALPATNAMLIPPIVALYSIAVAAPLRHGLAALGATALPTALLVHDRVTRRSDATPANVSGLVTLAALIYGAAWYAGRRRRSHQAELSDVEIRRREALAQERVRLARELHDTVSHAVSVILLQATGANRVFDHHPDQVREALVNIEQRSRVAMGELRRLLTVMRIGDDLEVGSIEPHRLAELDHLVHEFCDSGLDVSFTRTGSPRRVGASVEHSVYRIAQEGLTNVVRHAGTDGVHASVALDWAERLTVEVTNTDPGAGGPGVAAPAGGYGLLGLNERVAMMGGRFEAGRPHDRFFRVWAELPIDDDDAADGTGGPTRG
jgi:signal transduction histidine kinase